MPESLNEAPPVARVPEGDQRPSLSWGVSLMMLLFSAAGLLASSACFAGITPVGTVPGAASSQSAQSMYSCAQNCPPGDEKCVQTCAKLNPAQQQAAPANFQCLNQCTRAGYAYGYCKTLCSN